MPLITAYKVASIIESAPNTSPVVEQPVFGYNPVEPDKTDTGPKLASFSRITNPSGAQSALDKPVEITDRVEKPPVINRPSSVTGAVNKGLQFVGDLLNPKTAASFYADKASKLVDTQKPLTIGKTYRAIVTPVGKPDKILALRGKQITFMGHGVAVLDTGMWTKNKSTKDVFIVFKIG